MGHRDSPRCVNAATQGARVSFYPQRAGHRRYWISAKRCAVAAIFRGASRSKEGIGKSGHLGIPYARLKTLTRTGSRTGSEFNASQFILLSLGLDTGFFYHRDPFLDFALDKGVEFLRRAARGLGALREELIAHFRRR